MNKINQSIIKVLSLWILLASQVCFAQGGISLTTKNYDPNTGNQSWFNYEELAGSSISDSITIHNKGAAPVTIRLSAKDAFSNEAGSFSLTDENTQQNGLGSWTKLEKNQIILAANESADVDFVINIPKNTAPGEYFGGITAETIDQCTGDCAGNIQVKTRTGNRIYLTVPGKRKEEIKLTQIDQSQTDKLVHFKFHINNSGNVAFSPKAKIDIYDLFNNKIDSFEENLGQSFPNSNISPEISWNNKIYLGPAKAKIRIHFLELNQGRNSTLRGTPFFQDQTVEFITIPWLHAIYLLAFLALLLGFALYKHNKLIRLIKISKEYRVKENDTLELISEKNKISWQKLAQINNLKAPYSIQSGQILRIPKINEKKK